MSASINQSPVLIEQTLPQVYTHSAHVPGSPPIRSIDAYTAPSPILAAADNNLALNHMPATMESLAEPPRLESTVPSEEIQSQPVVTGEGVTPSTEERDQPADITQPTALGQDEAMMDWTQPESGAASTEPVIEAGDSAHSTNTDSSTEVVPTPEAESEDNSCNVEDDIPAWVKYEEDTSVPDEEEMKEIEGSEDDKLSALDIKAVEEQFFLETDDPEQRPVKKLRLSWTIKGVRGTRERPNYTRVMNSPGACIDGFYWSIKFYPRGDNCNSLSAFVRCSREPPPVDEECPESEFSFYQGTPNIDFSTDMSPEMKITVPAKDRPKSNDQPDPAEKPELEESKKQAEVVESEDVREPQTASKELGSSAAVEADTKDAPNWRVSAQLGMAIYNPAEPRTGHLQSDGHQFSKYCDDWGWVSFVGPWDEIHQRKRGQRQALLRNDTLAIDAYIQIYEDPTEALWWHESKEESQWPSKELAGYFPMGTPSLYHSPAVAGITTWFLMAPFRNILQGADGSAWRHDSSIEPKPMICQSQLVLDQMRTLSSDSYVNLFKIIEELTEVGEKWQDVATFWEVFRRGLELEFANDTGALREMSSVLDAAGAHWNIPSLPVPGSTSIQQGFTNYLESKSYNGALPNFLPIMLNRSKFDEKKREWKLHHDRVKLDDELELSKWCSDTDSRFTLYGFVVHVGPRNSGKFYSILRPGGIGTKWLAFEDGNGNKVFSYSKKRIQEFEGLEGEALRTLPPNQARENVYMAVYIRNNCVGSYLSSNLEPYDLPKWLKPYSEDSRDCCGTHVHREEGGALKVELYLDECADGAVNMLGIHELRISPPSQNFCRTVQIPKDTTFKQLRKAIARVLKVDDPSKVVMLEIQYQILGKYSRAVLEPIPYRQKIGKDTVPGETFRIWLAVQHPIGERVSYQHLLNDFDDLGRVKQVPEEDKTLEDIDIERLAAMIDAERHHQPPNDSGTAAQGSVISAVDVEQATVAAAVVADLENISDNQPNTTSDIDSATNVNSIGGNERLEGEEPITTDPDDNRSIPLNPEANANHQSANPTDTSTPGAEAAQISPTVVHGHLVDATQWQESSPVDVVEVTHASAHVVHEEADRQTQTITTEAPILDDAPHGDASSSGPPESATDIPTNTAAAIPIPRTYGNIQLFDADQQAFFAQPPFHPELDLEIGKAIKKHLGYDESRHIRIWKRQGITGTESVNAGATFADAGLQDVFSLIVGDALSETKCEGLKQMGKFAQPQHLMAYLCMLKRKHPHATMTSSDAVEIADYGNDYYKGPLCRGRPHGADGLLITSTGHTYVGPFVAGQKSGPNGKMIYQNGDTYVGDWLDDERHGQREHKELRTGNKYIGGFEKGKRWGQGVTYWQVADQQADMCQICYEEEIDALFYDCGHVCACVACAKQCDTCPLCRRRVAQVVKMYRA